MDGVHFIIHLHIDAVRCPQSKCPVGGIDGVAPDVAQATAAEVPPWAPGCGMEFLAELDLLFNRSEPDVPVHAFGERLSGRERGARYTLESPAGLGAIGPGDDFTDFADQTGFIPFLDQSGSFEGVSLVAHLGDEVFLGRQFGECACLPQ